MSNSIDWSNEGIYNTIEMLYRGDGSIQTGECFSKLANESNNWYKQRKQRTQQNNYLQMIVQNRYMPIFGRIVEREIEATPNLQSNIEILNKSVDNAGTDRDSVDEGCHVLKRFKDLYSKISRPHGAAT